MTDNANPSRFPNGLDSGQLTGLNYLIFKNSNMILDTTATPLSVPYVTGKYQFLLDAGYRLNGLYIIDATMNGKTVGVIVSVSARVSTGLTPSVYQNMVNILSVETQDPTVLKLKDITIFGGLGGTAVGAVVTLTTSMGLPVNASVNITTINSTSRLNAGLDVGDYTTPFNQRKYGFNNYLTVKDDAIGVNVDLNAVIDPSTVLCSPAINGPYVGAIGTCLTVTGSVDDESGSQVFIDDNEKMYIRYMSGGIWGAWRAVFTTGGTTDFSVLLSSTVGNLLQTNSDGLYYGITAPPNVANVYVDYAAGNDTSGNGTIALPFKTIRYALAFGPGGVNRTIWLKESMNHIVDPSNPAIFRGPGQLVIIPYGPGCNSLPPVLGDRPEASNAAKALNTYIYSAGTGLYPDPYGNLFDVQTGIYPTTNGSIVCDAISFRAAPITNGTHLSAYNGLLHRYDEAGSVWIRYGKVELPDLRNQLVCSAAVAPFTIKLTACDLSGSGVITNGGSKALVVDCDSSNTPSNIATLYLSGVSTAKKQFSSLTTNLLPPPDAVSPVTIGSSSNGTGIGSYGWIIFTDVIGQRKIHQWGRQKFGSSNHTTFSFFYVFANSEYALSVMELDNLNNGSPINEDIAQRTTSGTGVEFFQTSGAGYDREFTWNAIGDF